MSKIFFKIDFKEDAKNWVRVIQNKNQAYGRKYSEVISKIPKDILKKVQKATSVQGKKIVFKYLQSNAYNFVPEMEANQKMLEFYLKYKGSGLFKVIEKITGRRIYTGKFFATFTLMTSCPYDPMRDWFMVMAQKPLSRQVTNIFHEILHLQFTHYYYDYCLKHGLSQKQFHDLKESLTFLLNEVLFKKFYLAPDYGYSSHQSLRKKLKFLYDKNKKFDVFLEKAIEAVKK